MNTPATAPTLHLHHLHGCAPAPLAHYLKALGILRIVAEQKDPQARGWWQDEHFCLLTTLDRAELERFFLEEYSPTPVFNPWGARSGFYPGSSERTARDALEAILTSTNPRHVPLHATFATVRAAVDGSGGTKPETEEDKARLHMALRKTVRGPGEQWLGTVMALVGDSFRGPALVGSGGNEGSGSYVSAFLQAVVACTCLAAKPKGAAAPARIWDHALGLFTNSNTDDQQPILDYSWSGSFGQFLPEGEGSPWDFLFVIEGAMLFQSAIGSRSELLTSSSDRFLASPFYFAPHATGSGASAKQDEYMLQNGQPRPGRGEQWFPLWTAPSTLPEIEAVISEGRCSIGKRHASGAMDAARAIGALGVARGITTFCRYGYLQRNNLATHFAVPLGRIDVHARGSVRLTDELSHWLRRLHRLARDKSASSSLIQSERRLADSLFDLLTHDESAARWQSVLLAAAATESIQSSGAGFKAGPIPALGPEWLEAGDDGSPEWRLACALGSAAASYRADGLAQDPVRHHWLPLQPGARRFAEKEKRLAHDVRVIARGRDGEAACLALVERRLIESSQHGGRSLPLVAARGYDAHPVDLALLVAGRVDLARAVDLARGLMAVRWNRVRARPRREPTTRGWPDEAWMALRLACLPWPLDAARTIPVDDAMIRRLSAGDGTAAVDLALRRLRATGLRPPLRNAFVDERTARLWGASLAFPISHAVATAMATRFQPIPSKENR